MNELHRISIHTGANLVHQLLSTLQAGAGDGLISGDDQPRQPGFVMQRFQRWHGGHGGAIRVCNDALGGSHRFFGVHLGHNEGNIGVHPPPTGVVNDHRSGSSKTWRLFLGERGACAKNGDIKATGVSGGNILDNNLFVTKGQRAASAPG